MHQARSLERQRLLISLRPLERQAKASIDRSASHQELWLVGSLDSSLRLLALLYPRLQKTKHSQRTGGMDSEVATEKINRLGNWQFKKAELDTDI
jgi:hypothetical protein